MQTDWGFACYVEGLEKTILFDCRAKGQILLSNLEKPGLKPEKIEAVVLSHFHGDHTGGLEALLARNSKLEVWLPEFFPVDFKERIKKRGARVVEVTKAAQICKGALTAGVIEGAIREQSLVLETDKGSAVITGCAHPGIIKIIESVKSMQKREICFVSGGFHLAGLSQPEIKEVIKAFRSLGVEKVGPVIVPEIWPDNSFLKNMVMTW